MSRRCLFVTILVGVLVVAFSPAALAQHGCVAFQSVTQAQTPSLYQLNMPPYDVWGGDVFASLGAQGAQKAPTLLVGQFSGQDSATYTPGVDLRARLFGGMATGGSYTFVFGADGGFTVMLGRAVWNLGPVSVQAPGGVGDYQASGTVTAGTGLFAGATGNLTIHGPFWFSGPLGLGKWTPQVDGTICTK